MIIKKIKLILTFLLFLSGPLFSNQYQDVNTLLNTAQNQSLFPQSNVNAKALTQLEILIYMKRLLTLTQDNVISDKTLPNLPQNLPAWAINDVSAFTKKFGAISPTYIIDFEPKKAMQKAEFIRILTAYTNKVSSGSYQNQLSFNPAFFVLDEQIDQLIQQGVLPEKYRLKEVNTIEKGDIALILAKAAMLKKRNWQDAQIMTKTQSKSKDFHFFQDPQVSSSLSLSSDYVWRGLRQTQGSKAIVLGELELEDKTQNYIGLCATNLDFGKNNQNQQIASTEVDVYLGKRVEFNFNDVRYQADMGYIYYAYPDALEESDLDFSEVYVSLTQENVAFSLNILTHGADANFADDIYATLGYSYDVIKDVSLSITAGYYNADFALGGQSQRDLQLSLSHNQLSFHLSLTDNKDHKRYAFISYQL